MELMGRYPDGYFQLAIIDPPYGIGEAAGKNAKRNSGYTKKGFMKGKKSAYSKDYGVKNWDNSYPCASYFYELRRVSKNQIIWGANHFVSRIPFDSSCWIVWDKDNGTTDFADAELAYTSFKTAVRIFKFRWNGLLQGDMKNKETRIHPTQKPVALYKWLLHNYAKPGDRILDTHLGSGSIAIACHDYDYDLTACELDPEYYAAAMKRIEAHRAQGRLF